jgi:hypothetical protein
MRTARLIAALRDEAQELAFAGAEHFLQQVVDLKDADKETFWRQVFKGYVQVVERRGMRDWIEWQKMQNAALYADGENPRDEPTKEEEYAEYEAAHSEKDMQTRIAPERDFAKEDDEIPF